MCAYIAVRARGRGNCGTGINKYKKPVTLFRLLGPQTYLLTPCTGAHKQWRDGILASAS